MSVLYLNALLLPVDRILASIVVTGIAAIVLIACTLMGGVVVMMICARN